MLMIAYSDGAGLIIQYNIRLMKKTSADTAATETNHITLVLLRIGNSTEIWLGSQRTPVGQLIA